MNTHLLRAGIYVSVICMAIACGAPYINAQDNLFGNYMQRTGDYADIYNGRIETNYNILQYENLPYYNSSDFTEASIIYRKNFYPDQKVRLDLYREQLITLPPDKQYGVIVRNSDVDKVFMYNKIFKWMVPSEESGLKPGYYIHMTEGKKMQLFCKENYSKQQQLLTYSFDRRVRYYLLYNNRYHTVKNKGSFSKLFPRYKKQINQFAKEHQLNFSRDKDKSLIALVDYCEELLTSTNTQ